MKGINKIAKVVTRIVEILHWIGAALMVVATVCSAVSPAWFKSFIDYIVKECSGSEFNAYGFEINVAASNGAVDMTAVLMFCISAFFILVLMAMIFRNLNLIIKKSEGTTPFQPDNIRMFREIGYFSIGVPVIGLIMSIISRLVIGMEIAEISCSIGGFIIGIVVLCVSQFFAHGLEIEKDVEGLV